MARQWDPNQIDKVTGLPGTWIEVPDPPSSPVGGYHPYPGVPQNPYGPPSPRPLESEPDTANHSDVFGWIAIFGGIAAVASQFNVGAKVGAAIQLQTKTEGGPNLFGLVLTVFFVGGIVAVFLAAAVQETRHRLAVCTATFAVCLFTFAIRFVPVAELGLFPWLLGGISGIGIFSMLVSGKNWGRGAMLMCIALLLFLAVFSFGVYSGIKIGPKAIDILGR